MLTLRQPGPRPMAVLAVILTWGLGSAPAGRAAQTASTDLAAVIDAIVLRPAAGEARPDPATLMARLRAIDPRRLSLDEQIDRRFAETILIGRLVAAPAGQPMGEAAYTRMLQEQHLLPYDAAGLWAFAWREFDATVRQLEDLARRIDPSKTWLQIADEVKQDHPDALRMIEAHQEVVDRARAHLVAKDLMSLPWPETCTVVRRVPTAGNNPYYGNFSGATARPAAPDGTLRGEWHINPFDPAWDAARQRDYLVEHDWGVILVTAPHETYGGHHVQILYQMHNPRPLRRQQSTSMFSEGWGLYNEQLFQETGFLPTERLHVRQLQLRLWRNARVIYDVGMQTGRMTRDAAIALMVDRVGFLRWAAESEVDSAIARPGYFIGYFMGMTEILKMREEYRRARGAAFTLKDFHDRLLRIGSMPPALVREVLMKDIGGAAAQSSSDDYFSDLRWRLVGPHRAGRIWWVTGVPGDPAVYYAGTPAGALWKSTSGGTTWASISDALPVTGTGAVAVAGSDARVLYVGTGSNTLGHGVYRSNDAGATWQHAGLADTKYITGLLIDPRNPDVVLAGAGSGGNFGSMVFYNNNSSAARGVYRTTDGGRTWAHTLFVDTATSVVDLAADPALPDIVYASLSTGLYRSNDGGQTWNALAATGMSARGTTIAVAPGTSARRVYAIGGGRGSGGLFRSDDGGATFTLMTSRLASAGGHLYVDPRNPDVVYTMGTSVYRSMDGGTTLEAIKGAPGGDDPHSMWIDPTNPRRMIIGADQGPAITLDAGTTWTPWYTMPNGEFYFVSTDQQFPYRIYAAQQDSGTVSILSRSDFGAIRPSDWYPISGYEQGHIFADPLNPRYVYSHGGGHVIVRFDRVTGQSGPVFTPAADDRFGPRPGMDMSPKDPRWMFVGSQFVYASNDRVTWNRISADLTARPDRPATGTIVALAASPLDVNVLWAGTSNGLVHLTRDAGTSWTNVSPPRLSTEATLTLWSMEASSHDAGVAYAAAIDVSDRHGPALFMTSDFGATWQEIVGGLPSGVPTRAVREDPKQASLLYAATQRGVFVSFDRGAAWQPLQLNLPPAAVNDLTVHGDDLIAATWGRALWALDNLTPLRQMAAVRADRGPAFLFEPAVAVRVRWDHNQDTPLPPEVPQGQNPPDGVAIDYYLRGAVNGPVTIAIHDAAGALVREYSSNASPPDTRMPNVPAYWFKTPDTASSAAGMHRVVWDLRYPTPPSLDVGADGAAADTVSFGIIATAVIGQSPKQQPVGSLVLPGTYQVRLTVGGRTVSRPVTVTNDPRSEASAADLAMQLKYERGLATGIETGRAAIDAVQRLRQSAQRAATGHPDVGAVVAAFDRAAVAVIGSLAGTRSLAGQLADLEFADLKPTGSTVGSVVALCARADTALGQYRQLVGKELAALNAALAASGQPAIPGPGAIPTTACGQTPS